MPPGHHSIDKDVCKLHIPPAKPDLSWTRPPKSRWRVKLWRWRVWLESTFVLSMLEPWEKLLLIILFASVGVLLLAGISSLFSPTPFLHVRRRAAYYLYGNNSTLFPDY